jgi:hypothetical protein
MSVEDLINHITDENYSKAEVTLNDLLADRMSDALEQEKIAVASQIYNGVEPDDEEFDDYDLDDEEDELDDYDDE